jgi:hypothetical protein
MEEQLTLNQLVIGSNPIGVTYMRGWAVPSPLYLAVSGPAQEQALRLRAVCVQLNKFPDSVMSAREARSGEEQGCLPRLAFQNQPG